MQYIKSLILSSVLYELSHASLYGESNLNHTCQLRMLDSSSIRINYWCALEPNYLSCSAYAHPNVTDSCCTETFGGLVLSTQYWDTYTGLESSGQMLPRNTWTLHGLWPDFCNGSYTQYCDLKLVFLLFDYDIANSFQPTIRSCSFSKHHHWDVKRHSCTTIQRT